MKIGAPKKRLCVYQVNALPILSRIPGSAEEARGTMTSAIVAAFALSWAIYLAAAVLAFLTLGEQTTGDVCSHVHVLCMCARG